MESEEVTRTRFSFNKNDFNVWTYKVIEQQFDCRILSNYNAVEVVNVGKNSYIILLKKLNHLDNEIKVEVFSGDRTVYQHILTIHKQENTINPKNQSYEKDNENNVANVSGSDTHFTLFLQKQGE